MPVTININGLTLVHRGSEGRIHNTLPDVCRTPSKGRPVPYENEAYSKDLIKGTTTVFADGGNMIANFGSEIGVSVFDEPGTMGGVKSGTNMAEADWITHSFDVFFEGKPACRLTDKMFMNHRNTVSLAGWWQKDLEPALVEKICDAICDCRGKMMPTAKEAGQAASDVIDAVRGVHDTTKERADAPNEIHRRQACFASHFNESGLPWYGATPKDPSVLTEVPYVIPNELILSGTGRTTSDGGPIAPGSVQRALSRARGNPGTVVIWDMAVLIDPMQEAVWENVDKILEIKFLGDKYTRNQNLALRNPDVADKVERVDEADCFCDLEEAQRRQEIENIIRQMSDNAARYLPFFPGMGPGRGVPGRLIPVQ